jgi:rare lipoprotein A
MSRLNVSTFPSFLLRTFNKHNGGIMVRVIVAICAALMSIGLGAGAASASYGPGSQWLGSVFRDDPVMSRGRSGSSGSSRASRASRSSRRGNRVARDYADDDTPRATRSRRAARNRARLPSLTGGSGFQSGVASYYWQRQRVASGGWFNPNAMTAAHKTLPFGTLVRVTNLNNGRTVTVRINDRGPFVRGRVIDLSRAAASAVGMTGAGLARVSLAVVGR